MGFAADVKTVVSNLKTNKETFFRRVAIDACSRVIMKTPVDTGRARANWVISIDTPASGGGTADGSGETKSVTQNGVGQSGAKDRAIADITAAGALSGHVLWLTNTVPYGRVLEYGTYPYPPARGTWVKGKGYEIRSKGGYSKQAPAGMVRVTVLEVEAIIGKAAAVLRQKGKAV